MNIGAMRHKVTLLRPVAERNDQQEQVITFKPWRTIRASVLPEDGRIVYQAKQENNEVQGMIETRYMRAIDIKEIQKWRLSYDCKREYQIVYAYSPRELKKVLRIAYKEVS